MSQAQNVVAAFDIPLYALELTVQMTQGKFGSGSIYGGNPVRGTTIQVSLSGAPGPGPFKQTVLFPAGTVVTVRGDGLATWFSSRIRGACTADSPPNSSASSCTVVMTGNMAVSVTF
jgi:hypothetical protein